MSSNLTLFLVELLGLIEVFNSMVLVVEQRNYMTMYLGLEKRHGQDTFNLRNKVDLIVNNLCELFNFYILEIRDKPILIMVEWIRTTLIQRF